MIYPGKKLTLGFYFFAFAVFFNALLRDKNIENKLAQFLGFNLALNTVSDFLLLAGENVGRRTIAYVLLELLAWLVGGEKCW